MSGAGCGIGFLGEQYERLLLANLCMLACLLPFVELNNSSSYVVIFAERLRPKVG